MGTTNFDEVEADEFRGRFVGEVVGDPLVTESVEADEAEIADLVVTGSVILPVEDADGDGAIAATSGVVVISKQTAAALTLAAPTTGDDDGSVLHIVDVAGAAHVITHAAGFNGGSDDLATFGGDAGDAITLVAHGGVWYTLSLLNVTLSEDT